MTQPFIDTDVIIRLLTGDDPNKMAAATALFEPSSITIHLDNTDRKTYNMLKSEYASKD